MQRTESAAPQLTRTLSNNSQANKKKLETWLEAQSQRWASGAAPTIKDFSEGHHLVYTICSESSAPKDADSNCYILYLDYVRGSVSKFPKGPQRDAAIKALGTVFKYLDQHYTNTKPKPGAKTTKSPTSKLAAGQDLKFAAAAIEADPLWTPDYIAPTQTAAPAARRAKPAAAGYLSRTDSEVRPLSRTVSQRTTTNLQTLKNWVEGKAASWASGVKATPKDFSEGHHLVYTLCTEAGQPRNAEQLCYEVYLDYIRGVGSQYPAGSAGAVSRDGAVKALIAIFRYLDQHWTNTRQRTTATTKEPTSRLCPGQSLQEAANKIFANPTWTPDYQAVKSPLTGDVKSESARGKWAKARDPSSAGISRTESAAARQGTTGTGGLQRTLTSELPKKELSALKAYLFDNLELFCSGERVSASTLSEGYTLVYDLCTGPTATNAEKAVYMVFLQTVRDAIRGYTGRDRRTRHASCVKNLVSVFRYLDRWYTVAANKLRRTRTKDKNTLSAGQTLKEAAQKIYDDPMWQPNFEEPAPEAAAPAAKPAAKPAAAAAGGDGLTRTYSAVDELTRTVSMNTANNLKELQDFLAAHAEAWSRNEEPTIADKSLGHTLVYRVCSDSTSPRDAEFKCFDMFLDYVRGAVDAYRGQKRKKAIGALKTVFKYLDQHYTNTKPRPGAKTTKQATSKLASGQDLAFCAAQIEKNVDWLPDFYCTSAKPDGGAMVHPETRKAKPAAKPAAPAPKPAAPAPAPKPAEPVSSAQRYKAGGDRGEYYSEVEQRISAAQAELEADPLGFQQYLMSRAAARDPRLSSAVFAANSLRASRAGVAQDTADRALASMATSYAGSRLDPFYHSEGPLRDPARSWRGSASYGAAEAAGRTQAQYHAAAYARVDDPREYSRYGAHPAAHPMAHHARYAQRYGVPPGYPPF
jgi:hypothetical protein